MTLAQALHMQSLLMFLDRFFCDSKDLIDTEHSISHKDIGNLLAMYDV